MAGRLVACKTCKKEVSQSANSCPHCGERLKRSWIFGIFKWVSIFVVGLLLIGIFSNGNDKGSGVVTKSAPDSEAKASAEIFKIGDKLGTRKFEIQIESAEVRRQVGSQFFRSSPSDGALYVAVNWNVKNASEKPISAFGLPRIRLVDPAGTKYDPDIAATASYASEHDLDRKALSDLNPGIRTRDADVFEIASERFDPAAWSILVSADSNIVVQFK